ncbi:MAG: Para-aminobenzoate synthase, amidotransferase component / Para-aminobenzoate synthase, aminase component [uncultured Nocardioidaceae bacterium]|uniref:Para-aminobenzoate synthase, amidotransferase component / Para-aminobenzoate synthase, aminase component n=1 Tax=uncultured Nocardioidaceae bacterium TaxID=253824 RepID=A0A6J4M7G1_9ACTN|nr:MAG: Para-aminobenzoate synthase, amidotransferase component / Para-aminobenzoate synthase, aminase component [uncultured Nocardioidaceae bacterium]
MSPRVVVVDHHDSYTYNLVHLFAQVTGKVPEVVEHDETTADALLAKGFSHIVLSPGPGHPENGRDFSVGRTLLVRAEVPVLGVCLGLQGMVSVYGGRVAPVLPVHGGLAEIRHHGSGVFSGLPQGFAAVRYHSLACVELPAVLEETAWCLSGDGRVVMGVAHRDRPQWGVQFHPESILTEHGAAMVTNFVALG